MEASQPRNEILVGTTNDVSPRTVRTNWLRYSWSQISGATKVLLIISITLAIIQISATVTILAIGGQRGISCDKPLQLYLIVFVIRVGLSLPLSIYQHLFVPRRGRRRARARARGRGGNRNRNTSNNNNCNDTPTVTPEETTTPAAPAGQSVNTTATTASSANNSNTDNTTDTQLAEQGQDRPSTIVSGWADRLKSLLDLFAILWFIVGNYLVFSPSTCSVNAAPYYYTVLTWVLSGYTILLIPLLACASVIFCLPVILVALRTFNINVSNVMVGGSKEEIAKIPVFKYKAPAVSSSSDDLQQDQNEQQQTETVINTTTLGNKSESSNKVKKSNYIRKFMKRHQKEENDTTTNNLSTIDKYLTIPNVEDALCSICLSEYENDEIVCKLWCDHHYHQECAAEWLALNSKCPLCKRDFRGKDYINDDSDDEEEQV